MKTNKTDRIEADRINWIDIAKGIGILFVILGHLEVITSSVWKNFGASFHMPLFFVLSGMVFALSDYDISNIKNYVKKRILRLFVPYILWALIYNNSLTIKQLLRIVYANNKSFGYAGLWFLPVMLVASVLTYILLKHLKKREYTFISVFISAFICFTLSYSLHTATKFVKFFATYGYPFGFDIALSATGFMLLGYASFDKIKNTINDKARNTCVNSGINRIILFLASAICLGIAFLISRLNYPFVQSPIFDRVVMALAIYGNYVLFVIGGIIGSAGIVLLSVAIKRNHYLEYIGRNSLIYMVTNQIVISLLMKFYPYLLNITTSTGNITAQHANFILSVIYLFLSLFCCTIINIITEKCCPTLGGKA